MNKFCKLSVSLLVAGSFLISLAQSQEAPRTMTKVTTKIVEPKPEPGSFSAQAKTVWRAGKKYARTAEAPDSQNHIHGLAIINEPDAWMINLFDKSARHLVDPGPSFNVHLPVFETQTGIKTKLVALEFGEEVEFFAKNDARESAGEMADGKPTVRHEVNFSGGSVVLWTDAKSKKPVRISLIQGVPETNHRIRCLRR
ncbi:MAG: hypothetical protein DMG39_15875 [Acidobacteria bacterium]|nr:MAG: hypothetical protein DMG39_15875 [Acidobacteriota bacterium]